MSNAVDGISINAHKCGETFIEKFNEPGSRLASHIFCHI